MPFIYFVRHPVMLCFSKIYLAIGCFKNTALIKEIYGLLLFPVFLYFWNSLHHFCDKISISEVRTLRLTPILPLLICHLSIMSIYDMWQMPNRSCIYGNMGVKWSVWTSEIQILSQKWCKLFQKYRNKGKSNSPYFSFIILRFPLHLLKSTYRS